MVKLSEDTSNLVVETQRLVLEGFKGKSSAVRMPGWVDALRKIANTPDEIVKPTLGDTGQRLKSFAIRVNLDHPDLESFFGMLGKPAIDLFRGAADALNTAKEVVSEGKIPNSAEVALLTQNKDCDKTLRLLHKPQARLLAGIEDRKEQRLLKKQIKNVGLKAIFNGGENAFFGRPEHFKRYARSSKFYQEELKELCARHDLFAEKNMTEMSQVYTGRMRSLEESVVDTLGFYRLKPDEAAVILARLHGFRWNDSGIIGISSKYFDGLNFWAEGGQATDPEEQKMDDLKKALILNTRFVPTGVGTIQFNYQPRMYPLAHFQAPIPDQVSKVLVNVERFEALNDCAFFDYYWLLIPSININHPVIQKQKDHWTIRENGTNVTYTDHDEAAINLDTLLVRHGYIVPVIIGERDGKCYFTSMWA